MMSTSFLPSPYRDECSVAAHHTAVVQAALDWQAAAQMARPWLQTLCEQPEPFWALERLLREYPISSAEGMALMRLAEALLRVPDAHTAMALTADQLSRASFEPAAHAPPSALTRLAAAAIALSKSMLPEAGHSPGLMGRLGARTVVAAALRAVQLLGGQFVFGQTMARALARAKAHAKAGVQQGTGSAPLYSFDMLGEGARTQTDAQAYFEAYQGAIQTLAQAQSAPVPPHLPTGQGATGRDGISIKLSALHPRYEDAQYERVMSELLPRVWSLCEQAAQAGMHLTIDAEESERLELSLRLLDALAQRVAQRCPQWDGLGLAVQAYQTRALACVEHVIALARRLNLRLMCRLVKGAYWDAEIKRAQELGLAHYPVYTHKHHTDTSYLACARTLLAACDAVYPQFATHNAGTLAAVLQLATQAGASAHEPPRFELQRLHGMGESLYREVLKTQSVRLRVYAPVGQHRDLLAYLVRRLLENGANSSFVRQMANASHSAGADRDRLLDDLLASPLRLSQGSALPLPEALYGAQRRGSAGLDLTLPGERQRLHSAYAALHLPVVADTPLEQLPPAMARARAAFAAWSALPVEQRAAALRRAADALEQALAHFCALLVREAHKTWGDAVAEVREAVDFLRYYAQQACLLMQEQLLPQSEAAAAPGLTGERNSLRLRGRGVWVAISPWNFPLAIFVGQVAAALVTGNAVLAKPAEQTPATAQAAVALLHDAGVPADALQLLCGPGQTVGAALVAQPQIAGVVFTGSTPVAKLIERALAAQDGPIVPLIAETGGINAMLVDSSALPEQVTDAVVQSAFRSAGQRCSALRLLCLHEAIADEVLTMIRGAMAELHVGQPADWRTDVGPLIDSAAADHVRAQLAQAQTRARQSYASLPDTALPGPAWVAPQWLLIDHVADVREEIFGPVLHVVRWQGEPDAVIEQINALGYGLTLGLQTRIDSRAQALAQLARAGNVYVNRNMIGAVVGLQPFGGEGRSGTGPKAGGPYYLLRFCVEQTLTINTAAAGGNIDLLAR